MWFGKWLLLQLLHGWWIASPSIRIESFALSSQLTKGESRKHVEHEIIKMRMNSNEMHLGTTWYNSLTPPKQYLYVRQLLGIITMLGFCFHLDDNCMLLGWHIDHHWHKNIASCESMLGTILLIWEWLYYSPNFTSGRNFTFFLVHTKEFNPVWLAHATREGYKRNKIRLDLTSSVNFEMSQSMHFWHLGHSYVHYCSSSKSRSLSSWTKRQVSLFGSTIATGVL